MSLIPGLGRSPGVGNPVPAFLPGKFHGQKNLVGYSPCCCFKIIYFFMAGLGICCCTSFLWLHRATSFSEQAFALVSVSRLLVAVVSLVMEHGPGGSGVTASRLWSTSSTGVAHGLSFSKACGIFPDRGSNPCLLHWQAGSLPLCHRGSPLKPVNAHSYSL